MQCYTNVNNNSGEQNKNMSKSRKQLVSLAAATCVARNAFLPRERLLTRAEHSFPIVATGQSNSCLYCVSRNKNVLNLTSSQIWREKSVREMLTTPKKFLGYKTKCFLCSKEVLKKDKIYIFGKTSVDLRDLIEFAVDVNLADDRNQNLFVCKQICFRALIKILEARKKLETLKSEIETRYAEAKQGNERFKRLNKPDNDDRLVINQEVPTRSITNKCSERPKKVAKTLLYPTTCTTSSYSETAGTATPVAYTGVVHSELGNEHGSGIYFAPRITSTPRSSTPAKQKAPEVKVLITYPSKTVRKVLISEYESLAKALVYGEPCNIASAVMRSQELRTSVIQKVLELVAKEITGLCSRKHPSLLRKTSKSDLVNFRLQSLCEEWKARAPIFYSFLLTSSVTQSNASTSTWFPSMALAGSVLLKQRNAQMSATAHVMGILMKSGSIEVLKKTVEYKNQKSIKYFVFVHITHQNNQNNYNAFALSIYRQWL